MPPPALLSVRLFSKQCHDHGASDSSTELFLPRKERHSWPRSLKCFAFAQFCLSTGFRNRDVRSGDVSRAFPCEQPASQTRVDIVAVVSPKILALALCLDQRISWASHVLPVNTITRPSPARLPAFHLSPISYSRITSWRCRLFFVASLRRLALVKNLSLSFPALWRASAAMGNVRCTRQLCLLTTCCGRHPGMNPSPVPVCPDCLSVSPVRTPLGTGLG